MRLRLAAVVLLTLGLVGQVRFVPPVAATAPEWRDAGALLTPRSYGVAIPLADGRILVLDGLDTVDEHAGDVVAHDELFDPQTGRATPAPGRASARIHATATVLRDGRVLVAGGASRVGGAWRDEDTVELFDPRTATWREAHPLWTARSEHAAALLTDGRVLVAGGHLGTHALDSVEIYDPRGDAWDDAPKLPATRTLFSMATLPDGRVLVAGGIEAGSTSKSSLLYDPRANAWLRGPELAIARALHATVQLRNGDVVVIGGQDAAAGTAERYVFKRNAFVHAGSLVWPRMLPFAFALRDGRIVVGGGLPRPAQILDHFAPTDTTEVYDPSANTWEAGPDLLAPIAFAAVAVDRDGVWLLGGAVEDERPIALVQRYQ